MIPIALRSAIPGAIFDFSKRVITRHNEPHGSGFSVTEGPLIALAISDFRITGDPGGPHFRPSKSYAIALEQKFVRLTSLVYTGIYETE